MINIKGKNQLASKNTSLLLKLISRTQTPSIQAIIFHLVASRLFNILLTQDQLLILFKSLMYQGDSFLSPFITSPPHALNLSIPTQPDTPAVAAAPDATSKHIKIFLQSFSPARALHWQ